ncbi:MAG: ornithine cyclodeaminase family protein [Bryobacteraceae bacterium]
MRYFTEDEVRRLLPMEAAIDCLEPALAALAAGEAQNQPRRRLFLPTGAVLHSMAGAHGGYFGTKVYASHPRYGAHFTFLLYDASTATPLAQFEADHLGRIRTGAATGLAARLLSRRDASRVGLIGTGFQASGQLEAILKVRPVQSVRIWSRSEQRRQEFAREHSCPGVTLETSGSAEEAVSGADIIITATSAKDPVLQAEWVTSTAFVAAVGSNHPQRRELPADLVRNATVVVDSKEQAQIEAGDLRLAFSDAGDWDSVIELGAIITSIGIPITTGPQKQRADREDRPLASKPVVFKSVGLGLEDLAAAAWIYEQTTPAG